MAPRSFFVFLWTLLPLVARADIGFVYDNVAQCNDAGGVSIDSMNLDCNEETGCQGGDEVTIYGQFTSSRDIPSTSDITVKICKFWGYLCYTLVQQDGVNFCDAVGMEADGEDGNGENGSDSYCAMAGTHNYQRSFVLPESRLMNYLWDDFSFRLYVTVDDTVSCHAQFKTMASSGSMTEVSAVGAAALVVFLAVAAVQRKRTIRNERPSVAEDHKTREFDFGMMTDGVSV